MTAGGKGSTRRPTDEAAYSAGYDAIFIAPRLGAKPASKVGEGGPIPPGAAIYLDADSFEAVSEDWWPTIT